MSKATRGQAVNKNWVLLRTYILTASNFGTISKMRDNTNPTNVIKLLRGYSEPSPLIKSLPHGRKSETKARKHYLIEHGKTCNGL